MKTLIIFALVFYTSLSYAIPLEQCYDDYKKQMAKSTGKSAVAGLLFPMLHMNSVAQFKESHKIHKNLALLGLLKNKKNGGWPLDSLAKESNRSVSQILELVNNNPDLACNEKILSRELEPYREIKLAIEMQGFSKNLDYLNSNIPGPRFSNIFVPFFPDPNWKSRGFPFKECIERVSGYPIEYKKDTPRIKIGRYRFRTIDPKCAPDVVYNWTGKAGIQQYKSKWGNKNRNWETFAFSEFMGTRTNLFYTSFSPLATIEFGTEPIRIKLKKDVRILIEDVPEFTGVEQAPYCLKLPEAERHNTVFLWRRLAMGVQGSLEYDLCSFEAVHSWSYGLKQNYDEFIKDYLWFTGLGKDKKGSYVAYRHKVGQPEIITGVRNAQSFGDLKETLSYLLGSVLSGNGEILFNPSIPMRERTLENHFSLEKKIYWSNY